MLFGCTPISIPDMMGLILEQVQTHAGLASTSVFWTVATDDWHLRCPPNDNFITLYPESFPVWQSVVSGAGNSTETNPDFENLGLDLSTRVTSYTRLNSDQELRATQLMTNQAIGIMAPVTRIIGALQIWTAQVPPEDDEVETVSYLREPCRITDGPKVHNRNYNKTLWALVQMHFQTRFTVKLTPPATAPQ